MQELLDAIAAFVRRVNDAARRATNATKRAKGAKRRANNAARRATNATRRTNDAKRKANNAARRATNATKRAKGATTHGSGAAGTFLFWMKEARDVPAYAVDRQVPVSNFLR
eukprot:1149085-Pelagomonas_calceolata.AAC.4